MTNDDRLSKEDEEKLLAAYKILKEDSDGKAQVNLGLWKL
jgi:hypothetical protein